ncbi:MAG: exopolysaccharide biosynthesis polyprenyl glycosylphosphotransferase [Mucilaginibacter sp.]|nr:exopolysaccharide biosynthesis polyprenyl glycosylphosphotransferase [Mucilaginibacter sp.]
MKTRYLYLVYFIMSITDIVTINLSYLIANDFQTLKSGNAVIQVIVANYLWLIAALYFGLYSRKFVHSLKQVYSLTAKSFVLFTLLFFPYVLLSDSGKVAVDFLLLFYFIMMAGIIVNRLLYTMGENVLKKYFRITKPVAVIGSNDMALRLAGFFKDSDNHFAFEGFLHQEDTSYLDATGNVLPSIVEQIQSASGSGIKDIYVSLSADRMKEFQLLQFEAEKHCMRLKLVPDTSNSVANYLKVSYMGDFAVLSHRNEPLEEIENRFKKRVFDIIFSSLVIIFILSWLYPIIGLIIKLQSPGPILFKQLRSGKNNQPFVCYKFRSMKMHSGFKQATKDDDRITKIGKFLRKTSLDELPQFFNVFLGDMSTVGPRPHVLTMTKEYSQIINQYMVRHFLKSGITGWAQVKGYRGETKDPSLMQKRVEHDIWYLENWSMWLDFKIVFMTALQVIKGDENAY